MKNERAHQSNGCFAYVKVKQPMWLIFFFSSELTFCFVTQHCGANCQLKVTRTVVLTTAFCSSLCGKWSKENLLDRDAGSENIS